MKKMEILNGGEYMSFTPVVGSKQIPNLPNEPIYLSVSWPLLISPLNSKTVSIRVYLGSNCIHTDNKSISKLPLGNGPSLKGNQLWIDTTMADTNTPTQNNEVDYDLESATQNVDLSKQTDPGPNTQFDFTYQF
jgi:hypothetical protein